MKRVPNWIAAGGGGVRDGRSHAIPFPGLELRVLQLAALGGRRAHTNYSTPALHVAMGVWRWRLRALPLERG